MIQLPGLRFGWSARAHNAIHEATASWLNPSGVQAFVQNNVAAINKVSFNLDRYHAGPGHFVHIENLLEDDFPKQLPKKDRTYQKVQRRFTPEHEKKVRQQLKADPLTFKKLEGSDNVINSILKAYDDLKNHLQEFKHDQDNRIRLSVKDKRALRKGIIDAVGRLAHFTGDLHVPFHTTAYFKWPLKRKNSRSRKNAHSFFEGQMFITRDWKLFKNSLVTNPPNNSAYSTPFSKIKPQLLETLKTAYFKVYKLAESDIKIRQTGNFTNLTEYNNALRKEWRPIFDKQIRDATQMVSLLVNRAYVESGSPKLDRII